MMIGSSSKRYGLSKKAYAFVAFLSLLLLQSVAKVKGQSDDIAGEPFTVASLVPNVFLEELEKFKILLLGEVNDRATKAAEDLGVLQSIEQARTAAENSKETFDLMIQQIAEDLQKNENIEKIVGFTDSLQDSVGAVTESITGICGDSDDDDDDTGSTRRKMQDRGSPPEVFDTVQNIVRDIGGVILKSIENATSTLVENITSNADGERRQLRSSSPAPSKSAQPSDVPSSKPSSSPQPSDAPSSTPSSSPQPSDVPSSTPSSSPQPSDAPSSTPSSSPQPSDVPSSTPSSSPQPSNVPSSTPSSSSSPSTNPSTTFSPTSERYELRCMDLEARKRFNTDCDIDGFNALLDQYKENSCQIDNDEYNTLNFPKPSCSKYQVTLGVEIGASVSGEFPRTGIELDGSFGAKFEWALGYQDSYDWWKPHYLGFGPSIGLKANIRCPQGKVCKNGQETLCPAGYYCSGSLSASKELCREGYFCPPGSTRENGIPIEDFTSQASSICLKGKECKCTTSAGSYCPKGSTTNKGKAVVPDEYDVDGSKLALGVPFCAASITDCQCPMGFYCSGDGKKTQCEDGTYCDSKSLKYKPTTICARGYYCPRTSTSTKGEPVVGTNDCESGRECFCQSGSYCPGGSKTKKGGNCGFSNKEDCNCEEGFWCPITSTTKYGQPEKNDSECDSGNKCKCKPGYYCLPNSTSGEGQTLQSLNKRRCGAGNYCPATSSSPLGKPSESESGVGGCGMKTECGCGTNYLCPEGSTTSKGKPVLQFKGDDDYTCNVNAECPCPAGYECPCPTGSKNCAKGKSLCPPGYYCKPGQGKQECQAGYYCPEGSKTEFGQPVKDTCSTDNNKCKCAAGYWCPDGSTSRDGKPIIATDECQKGEACYCKEGHYCEESSSISSPQECNKGIVCPKGSTIGTGKPVIGSTGLFAECKAGEICPCNEGSFCKAGSGKGEKCPKGYYCPKGTSPDDKKGCEAGFFCPETSTTGKGKPKEGGLKDTVCGCKPGHWCPPYSTADTGKPLSLGAQIKCTADSVCNCGAGFVCPARSTSEMGKPAKIVTAESCGQCEDGAAVCGNCECPAGKYCVKNTGTFEDAIICQANTFCPKTSTSAIGKPVIASDATCTVDSQCDCKDGYRCPQGSTTNTGKYVGNGDGDGCTKGEDCECPIGFYCKGGEKVKCPAGFYCDRQKTTEAMSKDKKCEEGFWCPEGSTTARGKPVAPVNNCAKNAECSCSAGYWCPLSSTTETGKPFVASAVGSVTCAKLSDCACSEGYYCEAGSKDPKQKKCTVTVGSDTQYFCPSSSTTNAGQPKDATARTKCDASNDYKCICDAGFFCPNTSTSSKGQPAEQDALCTFNTNQCQCRKGNFCERGKGESPCLPGHFCPAGSSKITPCNEPGYWCPQGSTSSKGEPIMAAGNDCGIGVPCECRAKYYCPPGSQAATGKPYDAIAGTSTCAKAQDCECKKGFYCPQGSKKDTGAGLCSAGYYCPAKSDSATNNDYRCSAGHFCPAGSTTQYGSPVNTVQGCETQTEGLIKCFCAPGNYCPSQSKVPTGGGLCQANYFCPKGSTLPTGNPVIPTDGCGTSGTNACKCDENTCSSEGSIDSTGTPLQSVRWLPSLENLPEPTSVNETITLKAWHPFDGFSWQADDESVDLPLTDNSSGVNFSQSLDEVIQVAVSTTMLNFTSNGTRRVLQWTQTKATKSTARAQGYHQGFAGEESKGKSSKVYLGHDEDQLKVPIPFDDATQDIKKQLWTFEALEHFESRTTKSHNPVEPSSILLRERHKALIDGNKSNTILDDSFEPRGLKTTSKFKTFLNKTLEAIKEYGTLSASAAIYWDLYTPLSGNTGWDIAFDLGPVISITLIFNAGDYFCCKDCNDCVKSPLPDGIGFFSPLRDREGALWGYQPVGVEIAVDIPGLIELRKEPNWKQRLIQVDPNFSFGLGAGVHVDQLNPKCNKYGTPSLHGECKKSERNRMLRSQQLDSLSSFTKLMEQGHRQLDASTNIEAFTNLVTPIIEGGPIQKPFCFGACDNDDPFRKIEGSITIGATTECNGVELIGTSDLVSVSGLTYVIFESLGDESLANTVVDLLGPFGQFGLKNAEVGITAKVSPLLRMDVKLGGKPALPINTFDKGSAGFTIYNFLEGAADQLNFDIIGTLLTGEASIEFKVSVDPITVTDEFKFKSKEGNGPGIFTKTRLVAGSGTQTIFGLEATIQILVGESDEGEEEYIYLTGQIISALTNGVASFGGSLALTGGWYNMFGQKFFHLNNAIASVTVIPLPAPPFVSPQSVLFGASICVGAEDLCKLGSSEVFSLMSYISVDSAFPVNNYFVALTSELTADSILTALGTVEGEFAQLNEKLPSFIKNTGFNPLKVCDTLTEEELRESSAPIDKDCFVFLSFAPFGAVPDIVPSTPEIELELQQGISFSGQVNLFDLVKFRLETRINIQKTGIDLLIDAEMENFSIGDGFLEIGKELSADKKNALGGARLYVYVSTFTGAAQAYITSAITIPLIASYAELQLELNSDGASFESEVSLFGGIINPSVICNWKWDFTEFYLKIANIDFGIVRLDELILDIDVSSGARKLLETELYFKAKISVLRIFAIEGEFYLKQDQDRIEARFSVTADIAVVTTTISGNALIDLNDIKDSNFGDLSIEVGTPKWVEDVGKAIVAGVKEVGKAISAAVDAAGEAVKAGIDAIKNVGAKAIAYLGDVLTNVGDLLLQGVAFIGEALANVAGKIADGLVSLLSKLPGNFLEVTKTEVNDGTDKFGCRQYKIIYKTYINFRICIPWTNICTPKPKVKEETAGPFQDEECVNAVKKDLDFIENELGKGQKCNQGKDETQKGNSNLLDLVSDKPGTPDISTALPSFPEKIQSTVNPRTGRASVNLSGSAKRLKKNSDDGQNKGLENAGTVGGEQLLDFSTNEGLQASLVAAASSISVQSAKKIVEVQDNVSDQNYLCIGQSPPNPPIPPRIRLDRLDVSEIMCSDAAGLEVVEKMPVVDQVDNRCSPIKMSLIREERHQTTDPNIACGSFTEARTWQGTDQCGQVSNTVTRKVLVLQVDPAFDFFPPDAKISTDDDINDVAQFGEATGKAQCGVVATVENELADDLEILEDEYGCKSWQMKRIWTVKNGLEPNPGCKERAVTQVQRFSIEDEEAPRFRTGVPQTVRVPFFDGFTFGSLPFVTDKSERPIYAALGMYNDVDLLSTTSDIKISFDDESMEESCRAEGLISFERTWTARDKCGNQRTATQEVILEHPPTTNTTTNKVAPNGDFLVDIGMEQLNNNCVPGKSVTKAFELKASNDDEGWTGSFSDCPVDGDWRPDGCRVIDSQGPDIPEALAVKPAFIDNKFPVDVTINTNQSVLPENTGFPEGRAFCDTPYQILYQDDSPILRECGKWTIDRHWFVRPVYEDCTEGVPLYETRLVTERVQVITIIDIYSPDFIYLPEDAVAFPFLHDYGPN